jgi:Tol biopolymer transport system component
MTKIFGAVCLALLCATASANAQFGKNKVRYTKEDFFLKATDHFNIVTYGDGEQSAEFAGQITERFYQKHKETFRLKLEKKPPVKGKKQPKPFKPLIFIYSGHNEFQQTNVIDSYLPRGMQLPQGVGGVTEGLKKRVVLPFEGSYRHFQHVLEHELTHQFMYIGTPSLMQGPFPFWAVEGLPEYLSVGWDTRSDMIFREMLYSLSANQVFHLNLNVVDMDHGFFAYKAGQALWRFIERSFPNDKQIIQKIVHAAVRGNRDRNRNPFFSASFKIFSVYDAIKRVTGWTKQDLEAKWHYALKKEYWKEFADRDEETPTNVGAVAVDAGKSGSGLNVSPALSPDGLHLAYMTEESNALQINVMNVLTRKTKALIRSGQKADFEDLHLIGQDPLMHREIAFSADGKMVAFVAKKSGKGDVLYIVDRESGKVRKRFYWEDFHGMFSPAFSPDGASIAFSGFKNSRTDIYLVNVRTGERKNLTNDIYNDFEPTFHPGGNSLVYVSERPKVGKTWEEVAAGPSFYDLQLDLIEVSTLDGQKQPLMMTDSDEYSPVIRADGNAIAFISDRNGVWNVYTRDSSTGEQNAITNTPTGIQHLSLVRGAGGDKLAYVYYRKGMYEIRFMDKPFERPGLALKPTEFSVQKTVAPVQVSSSVSDSTAVPDSTAIASGDTTAVPATVLRQNSFSPIAVSEKKPFKDKWKMDSSYGFGAVASNGKKVHFGGYVLGLFSTQSGSERVIVEAMGGRYSFLDHSKVFLNYENRKGRDWKSLTFGMNSRTYKSNGLEQAIRRAGVEAGITHPFDRFLRSEISAGVGAVTVTPLKLEDDKIVALPKETIPRVTIEGRLVKDTVLPGQWGLPGKGTMALLLVRTSPKLGGTMDEFTTGIADARMYKKTSILNATIGLRANGAVSTGANPETMILSDRAAMIYAGEDLRDSVYRNRDRVEIVGPVHGVDIGQYQGKQAGIVNFQISIPTENVGAVLGPLGPVFIAMDFNLFADGAMVGDNLTREKLLLAAGLGTKAVILGMIPIEIKHGWRLDSQRYDKKPITKLSVGLSF